MYFTNPVWNSSKNHYKIDFIPTYDFEYNLYRNSSNLTDQPNIYDHEFSNIVNVIAEKIYTEGSTWFSSPIKPSVFLKRVTHVFPILSPPNNYGGKMLRVIFNPVSLFIKANMFEIYWKARYENYVPLESNIVEYAEDLTETEPTKTIIIQSHPADIELIENEELSSNSSQIEMELSSRAIIKKRVREARLKAAIATMKAEQMAEKYFRRYGIHTDLDAESELSFDSEEEDSE